MDKSLSTEITQLVSPILIHWIVIYPVDSAIQRLNNRGLGSTSDWSCIEGNLLQQITRTTQIWVATCYQYGISAVVPQTSFCWVTSGGVVKGWLFSQASTVYLMTWLLLEFISKWLLQCCRLLVCWSVGLFLVSKPAFSPVEIVLTVYYQQPFHALPDEL